LDQRWRAVGQPGCRTRPAMLQRRGVIDRQCSPFTQTDALRVSEFAFAAGDHILGRNIPDAQRGSPDGVRLGPISPGAGPQVHHAALTFREPHAEHRSRRETSGTGKPSGRLSTFIEAERPQLASWHLPARSGRHALACCRGSGAGSRGRPRRRDRRGLRGGHVTQEQAETPQRGRPRP
jgi:hypothetical protein